MYNKNKIKLAIAMLIFGSIGLFVKNIDLASAIIVQWRTYIGFLFLTILFIVGKQKLNINGIRKNIGILILTGIVLGTSWVILFESYLYTSVSMATLLYYCAPIIVFFLSACLFKERITRSGVIGISVAISGMIIINVVGINNESMIGIICGLLSAVFYALLMILNKYIKDLSGVESTFIQLGVAAIVMSIYVTLSTGSLIHLPAKEDIMLIIFVGIVHTGIACYLFFSSIQVLPTQTTSILSYIDPCSALIFSAVILNEKLNTIQIIGGILILGGIAYKQISDNKQESEITKRWLEEIRNGKE